MTTDIAVDDVPFPPEPGAVLGLAVRAGLWKEVVFALFEEETLKQTIIGPNGEGVAKLVLKPIRIDNREGDSFQAEMEVVDVIWEGRMQ